MREKKSPGVRQSIFLAEANIVFAEEKKISIFQNNKQVYALLATF